MTNETSTGAANDLLKLLDLPNVGELDKAIRDADPPLSRDQLNSLLAGERAGKTRKTAETAILGALERLDAAEREEAEAARLRAIAEADARLIRFGPTGPVSKGADPVAAARTGPTFLVIGDGEKEISGLNRKPAEPAHFTAAGQRVMYGEPIRISGASIKVAIRSVALIDEEGTVHGVCEIPGGVNLGGRDVELPAGSLIFG